MHIYISHYTKLSERRKNLQKQLTKHKLNGYPITWLTDFDREKLNKQQIDEHISPKNDFKYHPAHMANAIAHIHALRSIANSDTFGLILEDDLILKENFLDKLHECIDRLPDDWDMVYLSEGCNIHPPGVHSGKILYEWNRSRCASCYLVSNKAAKKILTTITPIVSAIDHQYNIEISKHNLKSFLLEPTIAYEGSDTGIFKSSV